MGKDCNRRFTWCCIVYIVIVTGMFHFKLGGISEMFTARNILILIISTPIVSLLTVAVMDIYLTFLGLKD